MLKLKLQYLKQNRSTIHQSDSFLLAKNDAFFEKCDTANLEMWFLRVQIAIKRQEKRMKQDVGDIRKYGQVRTKKKKHRIVRVETVTIPKTYKQLTINDQYPAPPLQHHDYEAITNMEQNEIQQRRLRMEKLVNKRKMRQRSILEHTQKKKQRRYINKSTVTAECQNDSVINDQRLKNDRNDKVNKRKNTRYILVTSARKRLRKSGHEPKTDR